MRKIFLIALTTFTMSVYSQTGETNLIIQNYIEVTGKAEMEIVPNEIYLKVIIDEKNYNGKKDLKEIEKLMIDKLIEIGIDVNNKLVVKDIVSNFGDYWINKTKINSIKEFQLIVNDAKSAGLVFQELESLGISDISIEKIEHTEIQKFRKKVKVQAIQAAKDKATSLTNAIDQNIGNAIYIQELNNINNPQVAIPRFSNVALLVDPFEAERDMEHNIKFEKIRLEYSILVRFELTD